MSTKSPIKNIIKDESDRKAASNQVRNGDMIKQEPEDEHALLSDPEDYLEENESLDMNLTNGNQKIWLVKLPRYLAERWTRQQSLNGQQLGQIKIRQNSNGGDSGNNTPNGGNEQKKKLEVKLVLNETPENQDIPQEYDLSILNTQVNNSYVFSEENLKRFRQEVTEMGEMPEQPKLKDLDPEESLRPAKFYRVDKNGESLKQQIPFVKTIPKKTSLVGKIVHDCQVVPLKTDSRYAQMLMKRQNMPLTKERPKVTFLNEIPGVVQSQAGPSLAGKSTSMFLKSTPQRSKNEGRAIRMPQKDLLDLLFRLFEEYEYWSIKGLKERTKQPETYLKESLESIANLIKKGPYTSKYHLKPEYRRLRDAERAAKAGGNEEEDKKEDDEDEDMEDVI
uniref:Transcription initiation factor IIF subunit beta n=1 Tax=Candidozyma auris TaxID=498019 RepID=A0A0L0P353_CANAR